MEHIIQFAVSVDDDRITELAEQAAADELVKQYKQSRYDYRADAWKERLTERVVSEIVAEVMGTRADEVAGMVADKLFKSQKFREKVAGQLAERGE